MTEQMTVTTDGITYGIPFADDTETIAENCKALKITPRRSKSKGEVACVVSCYLEYGFAVVTADFGGLKLMQFILETNTQLDNLGEIDFMRDYFLDAIKLLRAGAAK